MKTITDNSNRNSSSHDNVYGAVIVAVWDNQNRNGLLPSSLAVNAANVV